MDFWMLKADFRLMGVRFWLIQNLKAFRWMAREPMM